MSDIYAQRGAAADCSSRVIVEQYAPETTFDGDIRISPKEIFTEQRTATEKRQTTAKRMAAKLGVRAGDGTARSPVLSEQK